MLHEKLEAIRISLGQDCNMSLMGAFDAEADGTPCGDDVDGETQCRDDEDTARSDDAV